MQQQKNYYDILGVKKDATQDDIKKSFRKLSMKYHPDRQVDKSESEKKNAEQKFTEINEAYSVLGDETKRKEYDNPMGGMGSFFSGFNPWGGGGMGGFHFRQMASDINVEYTISLEDAYYGCKKTIRVNYKSINIDIPKGVTSGKVLRL